ncbi:MAG: TilS substrate binding domain protein [Alphaproteobacteria bacterium ADurb.Bin100]|nr:MAG: TilS substrate binding domain protein [Alphaproteobacteria bacterium ADurb.Bin100]
MALGLPPRIDGLQALSRPRQANALRHWLRQVHGTSASKAQLDELLDQLADCTTRGHHLHLKIGRGFVRRQGDTLEWHAA